MTRDTKSLLLLWLIGGLLAYTAWLMVFVNHSGRILGNLIYPFLAAIVLTVLLEINNQS